MPLVQAPAHVSVDCCIPWLVLPVQLRRGTQAHQEHASVLEMCFATAEVVLFRRDEEVEVGRQGGREGRGSTCCQICGGSLGVVRPRDDMAYVRRRGPAVPADVRAIEILDALARRYREGCVCEEAEVRCRCQAMGLPASASTFVSCDMVGVCR